MAQKADISMKSIDMLMEVDSEHPVETKVITNVFDSYFQHNFITLLQSCITKDVKAIIVYDNPNTIKNTLIKCNRLCQDTKHFINYMHISNDITYPKKKTAKFDQVKMFNGTDNKSYFIEVSYLLHCLKSKPSIKSTPKTKQIN
eukprot:276768_1